MKRYYVLFALTLLLPFLVSAQNFTDALRFSNYQIQGTARSGGMGNAFGALGGDFTSISINPAGVGIYQTGEFVITPVYNSNHTDITLGGETFSDNDPFFDIANIGFVGAFNKRSSSSGLVSINYGIGYNRLADFNSNSFANNGGSSFSYLDDIVNWASDEGLSQGYLERDLRDVDFRDWPAKLAWDTYLIDPATDNQGNEIDGEYVSILYPDEKVDQLKSYSQEGRINEFVFNIGLNFNHQLYLGATLGIHDLYYKSFSAYEELLEDNNSFQFGDEYLVNGNGYNLKLGAIFKPTNNIRLGLAFHSPTYYQISDEYVLYTESFLLEDYYSEGFNEYDYDFHTPLKAILSGAVILNKSALLSADLEFQNYSSMRFRNGGYNGLDNFNDLNSEMDVIFKDVVNLRIGGEYKLSNQFVVRAGYELYGNPYQNNPANETFLSDNISTMSFGFGYSVNKFSANIAYRQTNSDLSLYNDQPNYSQLAQSTENKKILLTLGFKF